MVRVAKASERRWQGASGRDGTSPEEGAKLQKRVDKKLRDIFDKDLKTQVDAAARAAAAKVVNLPLIALERACGADRPHLSKCSAWCQRCVPSTPDSWARAERDFLLTGKFSLA